MPVLDLYPLNTSAGSPRKQIRDLNLPSWVEVRLGVLYD